MDRDRSASFDANTMINCNSGLGAAGGKLIIGYGYDTLAKSSLVWSQMRSLRGVALHLINWGLGYHSHVLFAHGSLTRPGCTLGRLSFAGAAPPASLILSELIHTHTTSL